MPASPQLLIDGLVVEIVRRPVRQLRLSVRQLRLTVPLCTSEATIREVVLRKQAWIRHH